MNPMPGTTPSVEVTLENCDQEPIHIPGLVQPHGALLAFDAGGRLLYASATAHAVLGTTLPALGETLAAHHLGAVPEVHAALADARREAVPGQPTHLEVRWSGRSFDLIVHAIGDLVVAEFEADVQDAAARGEFALAAHRAMGRLKRQADIEGLLRVAVSAVRELTGFDRVMAYRFRHDDSGEVVAEDKAEELELFEGRRYPASDIPAQARRLYLINTLRLIADVGTAPVPVLAADGVAAPLDMSHSVLRSVSPIHIEYLRNMGVAASMSISIVIDGRLWGMLACHHRRPLQVTYPVRMACDVVAQVLAANVQTLITRERAREAENAAQLRARVIEAALRADDLVAALAPLAQDLAAAIDAQALVLAQDGRLLVHGELAHEVAADLVRGLRELPEPHEDVLATQALGRHVLPASLAAAAGWCGLLAMRFDAIGGGWLVALRREQIETIHWGGRPEKEYVPGPRGPRLTPRGSFEVWKEEVRGTSAAWTGAQQALAHQLLDELVRATAARMAELNRARTELLAMLGHDLRDPLQSISMAARVLEIGGPGATGAPGSRIGQRIQSSSNRMARLISQVLDASRMQTGLGLDINRRPIDLARLLDDLLDEGMVAYPGVAVRKERPDSLQAHADPDRIAQLFGNLLSNARHHGLPGDPVMVRLQADGDAVVFQVANRAPPIPPELIPNLYSAFKRHTAGNDRNKGGLGLGLHIAQAIIQGHGGEIEYSYEDGSVVFTARFPARPPDAPAA
ncbi:ATP-binding protein [Variovorax sp.]|uniref:ATP-binding protein n=1 Tax=Variovorax sp. TaxID=1871043 RepID=UPI002D2EA5C6|nr:ATP-binding protein [Variovorax sp.]HYP83568.1 ATP-binding protein [Variovorax sp.]